MHGTKLQVEITCNKISCYICATQLASDLLLKMIKHFRVMLNILEFFHVKKIVEIWLVYVNKFNIPIKFFGRDNETKLVPVFFLNLRALMK